jgi:hypothetical protein
MSDTTTNTPSLTEEAFEADRRRVWAWFTGATRNAAIVVVLIVILLAIFVA